MGFNVLLDRFLSHAVSLGCGMLQFQAFIDSRSADDTSTPITLACGHNSFKVDTSFVRSATELLDGVRDGTLEPQEVQLWGTTKWEYTHPSDSRAAIVVPKGLKGRLYKYGEAIDQSDYDQPQVQ